jgi:predicted transcriptional regulator
LKYVLRNHRFHRERRVKEKKLLYFKLQVDAGLRELDEGKGIPHEEVEKWISK